MDREHRKRGDNWTTEEKEIFMKIMKESTVILEDKKTDTNSNKRKLAEWQKVQKKLHDMTGKRRDIAQVKGVWRRMKLAAKKSYSDHRRATSPTTRDIIEMCPTDFIEERNEFDSVSIFMKDDVIKDEIVVTPDNNLLLTEDDGCSTLTDVEEDLEHEETSYFKKGSKTPKTEASHQNIILENNLQCKDKTFKLIEEEYALKIAYQKQEIRHQEIRHKLEIDILMLEKEKKAMELKIFKKNNDII